MTLGEACESFAKLMSTRVRLGIDGTLRIEADSDAETLVFDLKMELPGRGTHRQVYTLGMDAADRECGDFPKLADIVLEELRTGIGTRYL